MTRASSALASYRHGSQRSFFATNERLLPIGSYNEKFGVTLSLPSIVGRSGVVRIMEPEMSPEEEQALKRSAASLKKSEDGL